MAGGEHLWAVAPSLRFPPTSWAATKGGGRDSATLRPVATALRNGFRAAAPGQAGGGVLLSRGAGVVLSCRGSMVL